jgi:hypothetical protein
MSVCSLLLLDLNQFVVKLSRRARRQRYAAKWQEDSPNCNKEAVVRTIAKLLLPNRPYHLRGPIDPAV